MGMMLGGLYKAKIHPNTGIYWGFWINFAICYYFIYIKGMAAGIKTMLSVIEEEEQNNINN